MEQLISEDQMMKILKRTAIEAIPPQRIDYVTWRKIFQWGKLTAQPI